MVNPSSEQNNTSAIEDDKRKLLDDIADVIAEISSLSKDINRM